MGRTPRPGTQHHDVVSGTVQIHTHVQQLRLRLQPLRAVFLAAAAAPRTCTQVCVRVSSSLSGASRFGASFFGVHSPVPCRAQVCGGDAGVPWQRPEAHHGVREGGQDRTVGGRHGGRGGAAPRHVRTPQRRPRPRCHRKRHHCAPRASPCGRTRGHTCVRTLHR